MSRSKRERKRLTEMLVVKCLHYEYTIIVVQKKQQKWKGQEKRSNLIIHDRETDSTKGKQQLFSERTAPVDQKQVTESTC